MLRRDGDAAHDDVAVAVVEAGEDAVPRRIDEFNFEAARLGDFLHEVHVEADEFLIGRFVFKGSVGRTRADRVGRGAGDAGGEGGREESGCKDGFGLQRHVLSTPENACADADARQESRKIPGVIVGVFLPLRKGLAGKE